MRIKSAIDVWLSIIIWLTIGLLVTIVFIIPKDGLLLTSFVSILSSVFILWLYFGTYYELREEYLYCRSGPFFEKIKYEKIKSLKLTENLLSSMAMSRKRIEIRQHDKSYITGTTMISPKNREEFLKELISRCHNLDLE